MTTIVFAGGGTGGHLFPALAVADAVARLQPDWDFAFAGAIRGVEATVLPQRGLNHHLFPFEPIHRHQWWRNAKWPLLARRLVKEVDLWLDEIAPQAVVGTGGYVSGPVVWRAARKGIPTGILELDVLPGLATRLAARHADEIWLGNNEARQRLSASLPGKITTTGAPIIPPDPDHVTAARSRFGFDGQEPVLVITGGSQGSLALNRVIARWLDQGGGAGRRIIWATGKRSHSGFARLHSPPWLHVVDFLDPMADAWAVATLALTRAGMMTLAELAAWGIPAILVPLPTSAAGHQSHNAAAAEAAGAAICLPQSRLSAELLEQKIAELLSDPSKLDDLAAGASARGMPDAAEHIALRVLELVNCSPAGVA